MGPPRSQGNAERSLLVKFCHAGFRGETGEDHEHDGASTVALARSRLARGEA